MADWWADRSRAAEEARLRFAEVDTEAASGSLPERARLVNFLSGAGAARELCEELLVQEPEDAFALFTTGKAMLAEDDKHGVERLRRAADLDPDAVFSAHELAHRFLVRAGRFEEAEDWNDYAAAYAAVRILADRERAVVRRSDEVMQHGLPEDVLVRVVEALKPVRLKRGVPRSQEVRAARRPRPAVDPRHRSAATLLDAEDQRGRAGARRYLRSARAGVGRPGVDRRRHRHNELRWRISRIPGACVVGREGLVTRLRRPVNAWLAFAAMFVFAVGAAGLIITVAHLTE